MNGFAPEEVTQRGADPAAATAAVVSNAGSAVEVPPPPAPPGLALASAAGSVAAGGAGGPGAGQLCCLREEGERCGRAAGNASFSKRIQKSISQKKVKIELDKSVSPGRGGHTRGHRHPPPPLAGRADKAAGGFRRCVPGQRRRVRPQPCSLRAGCPNGLVGSGAYNKVLVCWLGGWFGFLF